MESGFGSVGLVGVGLCLKGYDIYERYISQEGKMLDWTGLNWIILN